MFEEEGLIFYVIKSLADTSLAENERESEVFVIPVPILGASAAVIAHCFFSSHSGSSCCMAGEW